MTRTVLVDRSVLIEGSDRSLVHRGSYQIRGVAVFGCDDLPIQWGLYLDGRHHCELPRGGRALWFGDRPLPLCEESAALLIAWPGPATAENGHSLAWHTWWSRGRAGLDRLFGPARRMVATAVYVETVATTSARAWRRPPRVAGASVQPDCQQA